MNEKDSQTRCEALKLISEGKITDNDLKLEPCSDNQVKGLVTKILGGLGGKKHRRNPIYTFQEEYGEGSVTGAKYVCVEEMRAIELKIIEEVSCLVGDPPKPVSHTVASPVPKEDSSTRIVYDTLEEIAEGIAQIADVKPEHSILDPKCGQGYVIKALRSRLLLPPNGPHVMEDNQDKYAELAVQKCNMIGTDFLEHACGTYDRIVCAATVEYISSGFLRKIVASLNPKGKAVLTVDDDVLRETTFPGYPTLSISVLNGHNLVLHPGIIVVCLSV